MNETGQLVQGRYELLELAGQGGMAKVYRAVARGAAGFQRVVAVKRIKEQLTTDTEFVRMFIEEARICSQLDHGNIVQVSDFGVDGLGYYLVMEWIDGVHLGEAMDLLAKRAQPLPWRTAVAIAVQVLAGLSAAHERVDAHGRRAPVIHRDVTPQNILIGVSGAVKLTDFGLARAMDRAPMTGPDVVKGKLSYMAPELILGAAPSVQSDLYSLGIVLWEALSGERLFWAETTPERVRKAREADVPPLESRRSSLPHELTQLVHRALARDPAQRFESAEVMHDALHATLGPKLVSARELSQLALDTRVALGRQPRSQRPPPLPAAPFSNEVVTRKVVVVKSSRR